MQIIDLSLEMKDGSLSYPGTAPGLILERIDIGFPDSTVSRFARFDAHCGTHLDAPLHFVRQGDDVATMPLILPEIMVISAREDLILPEVLTNQPSIAGKAVLFSTGWEKHAGTKAFFAEFPVLSQSLAEMLVAQDVALVGVDSPSVDPAIGDYSVHRTLLSAGIAIVEGLVNLPRLIPLIESGHRLRLAAWPLRIQGLEGSPIRAVALVESP